MERIAHRGAKREFTENTIPAFRRAFELGADAIELDVHATRDGVLVVHHDPTLRVGGRAITRAIRDLDFDALAVAPSGSKPQVDTLADVLGSTPTDKRIYVEIKGADIEAAVAEAVRSDSRCAVHSFDHEAIARMRALAPDIPRGVLFERTVPDLRALLERTGARDVWPEWRLIDQRLVDTVHALNGRVIAWTVNDRPAIDALAAMGVDGICTDDVRLF